MSPIGARGTLPDPLFHFGSISTGLLEEVCLRIRHAKANFLAFSHDGVCHHGLDQIDP